MSDEVLGLDLRDELDVRLARHATREVGIALGVDAEQQSGAVATMGEVAREVVGSGGGRLSFVRGRADTLDVVVSRGDREDRQVALTLDHRPATTGRLDEPDMAGLVRRIAPRLARAALEELDGERSRLELEHQGARALYEELSGELETTNRGVVALYAELDDKTRLLREASESKTRFLNNISHELRTPGNSVLGLARLLLDPAADPLSEEQRRQVEFVRSSAEDLLRLVNELLDLARAESGRIDPVVEPLDLGELFAEIRGTIAPLVTRPEVRLIAEVPADVPPLRTDRTLLLHVLRNLLSNAVKFTEAGQVTLSAARGDGVVLLTVRDTGIGIPAEHLPRVFEEFYQVRSTVQARSRGSGLGLPFARRVTRVLGGDIRMDSVRGEGTTVTVELPTDGPPAPLPVVDGPAT
jgi:signal transduction histidine kinase